MISIETIVGLLKGQDPASIAKLSAYFLAPALVLGLTLPGTSNSLLDLGPGQAISIAPLRSELLANGVTRAKPGLAIMLQPSEAEYEILLSTPPSRIWSSLDPITASANQTRLTLERHGVRAKSPLLGVSDPVTLIVEGATGPNVQVPGGVERLEDLFQQSSRSLSVLSGVLLACIFAFGMSAALSIPSPDRKKHAAS
jgi:hypothetical protein